MSHTRLLHVTPSGLRPVIVDVAPDPPGAYPPSKRQPLIENEDQNLDLNLSDLEIGTKARNREFQNRLDYVWNQTSGWESRLKVEARDAVETIASMKEDYQSFIDNFNNSLQLEIKTIFDKIDNEILIAIDDTITDIEQRKDNFVSIIVPDAIEKQSGKVSRQLKKAYETLDIAKQKESKREAKFVTKASEHILLTAQHFTDENALMSACFYNLEDDIIENERKGARMHLYKWDKNIKSVRELKNVLADESKKREEEDVDLLDTVIETQKLLQSTVLEHFGSNGEDDSASSPKKFTRLNKRMDKINKKVAVVVEEVEHTQHEDDNTSNSDDQMK